ncbi:MAG: hypothetical protein LC687_02495, partial [Actinobacteria bacterium]|nr:hypothetical protein [Actinomycetota bacterium]MCA1806721.1 hypothetical protein [Actinomycetota bacterium]
VQGSDDTVHVFESYIDVKEDVRKAMADFNKDKEKEELTMDAPTEEDAGEMGDELGEPQADESTELMLDKLDTVLDAVMQLADALHEETPVSETPGGNQVTTDQLMKSIKSDGYKTVLKSVVQEVISEQEQTVSLSQESTESFGRAIKSLFDGFEDRVVEKVVRKLTEETVVSPETMKSTSSAAKKEDVVSPGVAVDNSQDEEIEADVRKSVLDEEPQEINPDVLKSLTNKYLAVKGYDPASAQRKASIITQAENELNLSAYEFRYHVNKAYKAGKQ